MANEYDQHVLAKMLTCVSDATDDIPSRTCSRSFLDTYPIYRVPWEDSTLCNARKANVEAIRNPRRSVQQTC